MLIVLMKDSIIDRAKIRSEIMVENYPNILIQYDDEKDKKYLIGGFYTRWVPNQYQKLVKIVTSIDTAAEEDKNLLIISDMNLNRLKFDDKIITIRLSEIPY